MRITELWRMFGPLLSAQDKAALVAWKQGDAQSLTAAAEDPALAALLDDPMMVAMLADSAEATPPCHPDNILSPHAQI